MNVLNAKLIAGLCGFSLSMVSISAAHAWYGGPYGPYYGPSYYGQHGPKAMKKDRQKLMRDHAEGMDELAAIIDGRRRFDRLEATKLAREIEAGAGENMWRLYAPASVDAPGSRTAAPIWGNFETFKANSVALKETAGALADELEKRPTGKDVQEGVWVPRYSSMYGNRWGQRGGDMTQQTIAEYIRLENVCTTCHLDFRTSRWGRW